MVSEFVASFMYLNFSLTLFFFLIDSWNKIPKKCLLAVRESVIGTYTKCQGYVGKGHFYEKFEFRKYKFARISGPIGPKF